MRPLWTIIISNWLWLTNWSAVAQTYFNQRYQTPPGNTLYQLLSDGGTGWWTIGGSNGVLFPGSLALTLLHLDAAGNPIGLPHLYGAPQTNFYPGAGGALLPLSDGGMVLISGKDSSGLLKTGLLWRFTAQGDTLWTRAYRDPGNIAGGLIPRTGCLLPDGGFALVGEYYMPNNPAGTGIDILLLRTDSLGQEQWRRTYHQDYFDGGGYLTPTADGGFLIACATSPFSSGPIVEHDILMLKVDAQGREQRRQLIGGPYADYPGPLLATADGGFVMAGTWSDTIAGPPLMNAYSLNRPTMFWFDSTGTNLLRRRSYGTGQDNSGPTSLLPLPDGGYLMGGQWNDPTNASASALGHPVGFLLRLCADGDSVWYRTYRNLTGGYSHNYLRDVKPAPDGGFVGAGFLFPFAPDTGIQSAWVFKTDANGYLQAGGAVPGVVCRPVGLTPEAAPPARVAVWPNPAPDGRFTLQAPGAGHYTVSDALGREVARGPLRAGENKLDLSRQPSGLYLLRVMASTGRITTYKLLR